MKKFAGTNIEVESGFISHEDTTCWIDCDCGYTIEEIVSDWKIIRCPNCDKGYMTEFVVWQYDVDEK